MTSIEDQYDVLVIGAGVVGASIGTAMARQGRKVLIIERDWSKPDRIVGELMQPGGIKALQELGMVNAINDIDAVHQTGYYIKYGQDEIEIEYPYKEEAFRTNAVDPVNGCVFDANDKLNTDSSIKAGEWEKSERVRGVAFRHGEFVMNLRNMAKAEANVTWVEGNVSQLTYDQYDTSIVNGVVVKSNGESRQYYAKLTLCCDGLYLKFRKEVSKVTPHVGSYFVGLSLFDADLPAPNHGHVILGNHAPILVYQISTHETRILCAYRSTKAPSLSCGELVEYFENEVMPSLPKLLQPSFAKAVESRKFRPMPNQYLPAVKQGKNIKGMILLGDALNMRHPLTGGGMTVGLSDAALLAKLIDPEVVPDLCDYDGMALALSHFHTKRKCLDSVINTLSIALYTLFAADKNSLKILQRGCFKYFLRGGDCVAGPIGLLSGMLPFPMLLFNHFFSVAFYSIYCNFLSRGLVGFPVAFVEAFSTIFTAVLIFTPYLWNELVS